MTIVDLKKSIHFYSLIKYHVIWLYALLFTSINYYSHKHFCFFFNNFRNYLVKQLNLEIFFNVKFLNV